MQVLYSYAPADLTFWAKLRSPKQLFVFLLLLFPYYGVSLWTMFFLLFSIDWRCDYQLINYIAVIKGLSFVTVGLNYTSLGLVKCTVACWKSWSHSSSARGLLGRPAVL